MNYSKINQASVQLDNGEIWACTVDSRGYITLTTKISQPEKPRETKMPSMPSIESRKPESGKPTNEVVKTPNQENTPLELPEVEQPISDNVFRQRLANVMTDNMFDRRVRGSKRGKLDMMRLWKAKAGANNIFQKKQERKNKKYNIVLLIDESGSMCHKDFKMVNGEGHCGRSRIDVASEMAVFLARSFEGLNLDLAIVGFNSLIMTHKDFNEKVDDYDKLQATIVQNTRHSIASYNHDLDAISKALKMFKGREGKNLLYMISDGQPTCRGWVISGIEGGESPSKLLGRDYEYTDAMGKKHQFWYDKNIPASTDRNNRVVIENYVNQHRDITEMYGIGINSDCWQMPEHDRIDDIEELKPKILAQIKSKIRRG